MSAPFGAALLGRELDERLLLFFSFFASSAPLSAALERKVGERGHQHDRGMGHDHLEDVLVPAGGDAKEEPGHEHCRQDGCYNWNLVFIVEFQVVITTKRRGQCNSLPTQRNETGSKEEQEPGR